MTKSEVDVYIEGFTADVQTILQEVRAAIQRAAPEAEKLSVTVCQRSSNMASSFIMPLEKST